MSSKASEWAKKNAELDASVAARPKFQMTAVDQGSLTAEVRARTDTGAPFSQPLREQPWHLQRGRCAAPRPMDSRHVRRDAMTHFLDLLGVLAAIAVVYVGVAWIVG